MELISCQEKAENTEHTEITKQPEKEFRFPDHLSVKKFRVFRILSSANITVDTRRYMLTVQAMTGYATFILEI